MSYGAMEIPNGAQKHLPKQLHRQAMAAIAGICAVTLMATCVVLSRGTVYTGLLEVQNERLPFARMEMLVNSPAWKDEQINTQMLSEEKKAVGHKLASEMKKVWHAKDKADKVADEKKFGKLKARFESILAAMQKAPVLRQLPETSSPAMRVVDPRSGKVYQLYDWKGYDPVAAGDTQTWELNPLHADDLKGLGDFEDGVTRDPTYQGEYPDYAAIVPPFGFGGPVSVKSPKAQLLRQQPQALYDWTGYDPVAEGDTVEWEPNPLHADDMKGLGDFANGFDRNPTYQGEYPDYDAIQPPFAYGGPVITKGSKTQTLYPYDPVAQGDSVTWDPHPLFAGDMKGLGDFSTPTDERVGTYQGVYPDYESWPDFQGNIAPSPGRPAAFRANYGQTLYPYDPVAQGDAVTWDPHPLFAGDMKGLGDFSTPTDERVNAYQGTPADYESWPDFQGNIAPSPGRPAAFEQKVPVMLAVMDEQGQLRLLDPNSIQGLEMEQLVAHQQLAARRQQMRAQLAQRPRQQLAARRAAPKQQKQSKHAAKQQKQHAHAHKQAASVKKGQVQMLADLDSSGLRTWGKVYDPKLLPLPAEARSVDPNPMSQMARSEYKHWSTLADKLNDVYDPVEDKSPAHNMPKHLGLGKDSDWWSAKKYDAGSPGAGSDAWWSHNHAGRGY